MNRDRAVRLVARLAAATFVGASGAPATDAQEPPQIALGPPDAVAAYQFTYITSVRELSDGTMLVTDRVAPELVHIRWESPDPGAIGRRGGGPGEYQGTLRLYPLAGDTTLLYDSYNGRWSLIDGARIVTTLSEHRPLNRMFSGNLAGSDTLGHVLGLCGYTVPDREPAMGSRADSAAVVLAEWRSEWVDTMAHVKGSGFTGVTIVPARAGRPPSVVVNTPFSARDEAVLFPDGWIAVARLTPYQVDWRAPDGRWIRGAPLPWVPIPVTDREKCAAMPAYAGDPCDPSVLDGWPETIPPFLGVALRPAPDGRLLIARTRTADSREHRYDVVDRRGRLTGTIELPANARIVGVGSRSVYVAVTGEWDLQTLQRRPWP